MTWAIGVFFALFFAYAVRNTLMTRRFKGRFGTALVEEIKRAYPDSASLLTPDLGSQISQTFIDNKDVAKEINALEADVAKRPDITSRSYAHFDPYYSRETQELIVDLLKHKIELSGKIFNCLPAKVRSQINKQAEAGEKAEAEAYSGDEEYIRERKKDEERAKHLGLDTWRFSVLMTMYEMAGRANLAASR
jgi:hypothetical protein